MKGIGYDDIFIAKLLTVFMTIYLSLPLDSF